jgi:hypothetical protein
MYVSRGFNLHGAALKASAPTHPCRELQIK